MITFFCRSSRYTLRCTALWLAALGLLAACDGGDASQDADAAVEIEVDGAVGDAIGDAVGDGVGPDAAVDAFDAVDADDAAPDVELPSLTKESGFVVLEPVTYELKTINGFKAFTTDEARVWVSFQPAREQPETKPVAVFFNGGPGSATDFLLAFNTGAKSLDATMNGGVPVGPSPADWSAIANLLYVDARNTGFSYSVGVRSTGMTIRNFNAIVDAADFVRVVLRVLAVHPALRANPVVLVGESYGGTRAALMEHLLLFHGRYDADGEVYRDPALVAEIRAHLAATLAAPPDGPVPPEDVARQFGRMVLIQPYLLGDAQDEAMGELFEEEGSPPYQLEAETGEPFTPCKEQSGTCNPEYNTFTYVTQHAKRDLYKYDEASTWSNDREVAMLPVLLSPDTYEAFLDQDPRTIGPMYASERSKAYKGAVSMPGSRTLPQGANPWRAPRLRTVAAAGSDLEAPFRAVFGTLGKDDAYYAAMNLAVWALFEAAPFSYHTDRVGGLFLEALLYTDVFVTAAGFDLICYSPAVPVTLARRAELQAVSHAANTLALTYAEGAFPGVGAGTTRAVRFQPYPASGHSVPMAQPVELLGDVRAWAGW